jgi:hypothetical protein
MSDAPGPEYREVQRFRQPWLWALLLLALLPVVVILLYGLYRQLVVGQPWGDRPMSDGALVLLNGFLILLTGGVLLLFARLRLEVEVRAGELRIRFRPFVNRTIPLDRIVSCEARTYRPIREFGGWGIRYGFGGMAYNVQGNEGVQLTFVDGKRLLIGSQSAEELAGAIDRARGR